jgi:uncharacterized protein YndB with AHSA1/START domain
MTEPGDQHGASAPEEVPPLRLSRVFHARPETVFKAWGAAEHVQNWFSPKTYAVPEARVDMRVGGVFEVCMRAPSGERHWTRGRFLEVTPHERLVLDLHVEDLGGRTLFTALTEVSFAAVPGGWTRMDVVQTYAFRDPGMAAPMVAGAPEGWRTTLDKFEETVLRLSGAAGAEIGLVVHGAFLLERLFEAPRHRLWRALTDPEAKATWFNGPPDDWELLQRSMDVREGGREVAKGRFSSGLVSSFEALYHDVVAERRLVYSYVMRLNEKKISVSLATMQLESEGAQTRLLVDEQGAFLDGYDDNRAREEGTNVLLDALAGALASLEP